MSTLLTGFTDFLENQTTDVEFKIDSTQNYHCIYILPKQGKRMTDKLQRKILTWFDDYDCNVGEVSVTGYQMSFGFNQVEIVKGREILQLSIFDSFRDGDQFIKEKLVRVAV